MTHLDLTPLFHSTIGFDHIMNLIGNAMEAPHKPATYPPYNIIKLDENAYQIVMAVAGFTEADLTIVVQNHDLLVEGKSQKEDKQVEYLHRGIASRSFEKRFQLADFIEVREVTLENGLLTINLQREIPESHKPRQIKITKVEMPKLLEKNEKKSA